jgi:hypothetical protein
MATHGRTGLGHLVLGSVPSAWSAWRRARCSPSGRRGIVRSASAPLWFDRPVTHLVTARRPTGWESVPLPLPTKGGGDQHIARLLGHRSVGAK